MTDTDCVAFLQWALPQLGRRWAGYRKVRRRVCRKVQRRIDELHLDSVDDYRARLAEDPSEWSHLDALLDVTISRFYRDRAVFDFIGGHALPTLVERATTAGNGTIRVWSAGCASGEEPYTLAVMWKLAVAATAGAVELDVLATDIKPTVLRRAEDARYPRSAVRDLPASWREVAFVPDDDDLVLRPEFRRGVTFAQHDIRAEPPDGPFDLILCRYQAFTYFDDTGQRHTLEKLAQVTRAGAVLVLGNREELPPGQPGFRPLAPRIGFHERCPDP